MSKQVSSRRVSHATSNMLSGPLTHLLAPTGAAAHRPGDVLRNECHGVQQAAPDVARQPGVRVSCRRPAYGERACELVRRRERCGAAPGQAGSMRVGDLAAGP